MTFLIIGSRVRARQTDLGPLRGGLSNAEQRAGPAQTSVALGPPGRVRVSPGAPGALHGGRAAGWGEEGREKQGAGSPGARGPAKGLCKSLVALPLQHRPPSSPMTVTPFFRLTTSAFRFSSLGKGWDFLSHLGVTSGKG